MSNAISEAAHGRTTLFFWLCKPCSAKLTLRFDPGAGITVVPLARRREARQRESVVIAHESSSEPKQTENPRLASDPLQLERTPVTLP